MEIQAFPLTEILLIAIVFFSASQQTVTGFGFSLILMPLFTIFFGLQTAAPLVALQGVTLYVVNLLRYHVNLREAVRLGFAAAIGVPVGIWALVSVDASIIKSILGLILVIYAIYSLAKPASLHLQATGWFLPFGFIGGCLAGAYNTPGPMFVFYGTLRGWQKEEFRAILQVLFLLTGTLTVVSHWLANHLTPMVSLWYLITAPALLVGVWVGSWIDRKVNRERFRVLITIMILILGLSLILESFRR
jgi:uncharacterized membrane protein YfcA